MCAREKKRSVFLSFLRDHGRPLRRIVNEPMLAVHESINNSQSYPVELFAMATMAGRFAVHIIIYTSVIAMRHFFLHCTLCH